MPLQIPQLDDRSFEQIFAEARARIPVHTPEWTNFNESDPGITLVQLFAFMTENLLYRSNRIPELNRRKFLSLLGVPLRPAAPGRGLVSFRNDRGPAQPWPLEAGAELRAGKVPFRTRTGVCILPISAEAYYKRPRTDLDASTKAQYQVLYQTFLNTPVDQLQYYQSTRLEPPIPGKPLPMVDLADPLNGTIDRSLWVALVAPKDRDLDAIRAALAGQTLALGVYPAPRCPGQALRPEVWAAQAEADPGLIFEIAAPDPLAIDPKTGAIPARYVRLKVEYAENVLERPGIVQVRLPEYADIQLWDFDPEEEGTGDYPPLIEDKELAKRIVTWIRIRLREEASAAAANVAAPVTPAVPVAAAAVAPKSPCGCQGGASSEKPSAAAPAPDVSDTSARVQQQARLAWVGANAARVLQALPVRNERLGVGTGAPDQVYRVANTPVIVDLAPDERSDSAEATSFVLEVQQPDRSWQVWTRTDDLYTARRDDKVFALDPESGVVTFGDGLRGMRPSLGAEIRASYEYGGGSDGLVAIGALNKCAALPGGFKVENPIATWGADPGETVADGERNITRYLRHRDRVVTVGDFRDVVLRTPGVDVGRVEILPLFNPEQFNPLGTAETWPGTVTVLVIPKFDVQQPDAPQPDRLFLRAVCDWLEPRRLVTTELYIYGPCYVPIWVSVGVVTQAGYVREQVHRDVQVALREYLSPLIGGPPVEPGSARGEDCLDALPVASDPCPKLRGVGWPLGVEVRRQDLEAVVTRVRGVRYVDAIKLGMVKAGVAVLTDVERVPIAGLQLPRLVGVSVAEGPPEELEVLTGQKPLPTSTDLRHQVPVPVLPKKC